MLDRDFLHNDLSLGVGVATRVHGTIGALNVIDWVRLEFKINNISTVRIKMSMMDGVRGMNNIYERKQLKKHQYSDFRL